jgi:general secretion pathway protein A
VVLLIDEAQDLSPEVLEQIRLLSNLETDTEKLIQIVLLGQPELLEMLARRELRQLAQRVTARYHIGPLNRPETDGYVQHRIQVAGGLGKVAFTSGALAAVHAASRCAARAEPRLRPRAARGYPAARHDRRGDGPLGAREVSGSGSRLLARCRGRGSGPVVALGRRRCQPAFDTRRPGARPTRQYPLTLRRAGRTGFRA